MTDPTGAPPAAPAAKQRPASLTELFISLTSIALQGFGGVLAIVQREMVERRKWMTPEEFLEDWAVAQIMPGPNVVNLSLMIGDRWFGLRGALVAVAAMLTVPLLVVLLLALVYAHIGTNPHVASALRGMGAVAAGLITATGLKLMSALGRHPMGIALVAAFGVATFIGIALLRLPLAWVLIGLGGLSCAITWRRIGARA
jgi:chromate transporter